MFLAPTVNRADIDGSGEIDLPDFIAFAAAFGNADYRFDFNEDGTVDFSDFLMFVRIYGRSV